MDKRTLIAIGACIGVLIVWTQFFAPKPENKPAQQQAQQQPAPTQTAPAAPPTGQPSTAPGAPTGGAAAASPAVDRPEKQVELLTPEVRFVLSSRGGTLVHAQLRQKQFLDRDNDPASGHDVVRATDAIDAPLRTQFPGSGFPTPADGAWEVSQPDPNTVVFAADVGTVHIEKRYRVDKARYRLLLDIVVTNRGDAPLFSKLLLSIGGRQDPDKRGGGFFSGVSANVSSALCYVNGKVHRQSIESLGKDPIKAEDGTGTVGWIATDEKFFLLAAVPSPEVPPQMRTCAAHATGVDAGQVTYFADKAVGAKAEVSYPFVIFAGPKDIDDLQAVQPQPVAAAGTTPGTPIAAPAQVNLDEAVDVTFAFLSKPIVGLLKFFHGFTHNWGFAIVLLTLFIKLVTFYPTQKSLLSAKKMQKLAPKMAAIRKKYENDRQRQSVETMNLYKAHGVSPFGGCLPSLIQMPIWIALYSTLNYAVELYRAPFVAHLHDLTAKDPYYITPLVMGGVMFGQMKMSPAGADPQQQAMMSVLMPIMFTGFSLFLPSGLAVYMLTSYLFGILQQLYVNYLDRKGKITV
jgi:YidC/Oxa1 family membrane protein insertase